MCLMDLTEWLEPNRSEEFPSLSHLPAPSRAEAHPLPFAFQLFCICNPVEAAQGTHQHAACSDGILSSMADMDADVSLY